MRPDETEFEPAAQLLDAGDVAEMLGVSREWVYEQSRRGRIPTVTLGRYRRYRRSSVDAWVAQLERRRARSASDGDSEHGVERQP